MESSESWWRKPAESAAGAETTARPSAEISGSFEDDLDSKSIGEVIDQAIGDFDSRLAELRERVEQKRAEVADLEVEIADVEKEQAKAFKELLSSNRHIKRMLAPKPKRKSVSRRKKASKAPSEDVDRESLL